MKGRKDFAGVLVCSLVLSLILGNVPFSFAQAQEGQFVVVKKPFVMYIAQSRQGGVFDFDLNKVQPNTKYSSLALDSPVAVLGSDVSGLLDTDIKDSFELWSPVILLGRERAVLSCYFAPNSKEYLDYANCKAPLSLGKDRGRAVMMGYLALITADSANQNESFFAFVPDDGTNPVFGERGILPTPTPYPTATPAPTLEPTPSAREVDNALSSEGLETITAEKQMPLDDWISEVAKERGISANDLRVINGASYDENGKVVGTPDIKSRKVGGIKLGFIGIWIGGRPYTIPGESTLFVPRRQLLDGLEIVDLEPAVLEIAQRYGVDISYKYGVAENPTFVGMHDTATEGRMAPPLDIEVNAIRTKFKKPCYNFIIDEDGTIYKTRSFGYVNAAIGDAYEMYSITISFNTSPKVNGGAANAVQQTAGLKLATYLAKMYGIDPLICGKLGSRSCVYGVYSHEELKLGDHVDPVGIDMDDFRRKVADLLAGSLSIAENSPKLVAPTPQTVATDVPTGDFPSLKKGVSTKELVRVARLIADKFGIPQDVFLPLIHSESDFRQWDESGNLIKGNSGLGVAQIVMRYHPECNQEKIEADATENMLCGAKYLADLYSQFGNWDRAVLEYKGSDRQEWFEIYAQRKRQGGFTDPISGVFFPWAEGTASIGADSDKMIALTFDGGIADTGYGSSVMSAIRDFGIKATVFLAGQYITDKSSLAVVKAIRDLGLEVANHSFWHQDAREMTCVALIEEINSADEVIISTFGKSSKPLFRFPFGYYNQDNISCLERNGWVSVQWDVVTRDFDDASSADAIYNDVVKGVNAGGSIVILHLGGRNTAKALEKIIPEFKQRGYRFVTVGELLGVSNFPSTREDLKAKVGGAPPRINDSIPGQPSNDTAGKWQLPVKLEDLAFICRTAEDHRSSSSEIDPAIDFCGKEGTEIYPIGAGMVIWTSMGNESGLGEWVQVFHPSADNPNTGIISTYAHLNQIFVQMSDKVTFDTPLGTLGWTGATGFGPHVHVAVENAPSGKWREGAPKLGQDDMLDGDAFFKELIAGLSYCKMCNVP